jgi:hypothetical protein
MSGEQSDSYIRRLLSIHACTRGIAYVVFEDRGRLVDWGLHEYSRKPTVDDTVQFVGSLLLQFEPDSLILRKLSEKKACRPTRANRFRKQLLVLVKQRRTPVRYVSSQEVYHHFTIDELRPTKSRIARAVAGRYSELASIIPVDRPLGVGEDPAMALFDAAATALTARALRGR